jgi:magnesium transporter
MKKTSRRSSKRRSRWLRRRTPPGAAPGTIVTDPDSPRPAIRVQAYGPDQVQEGKIDDPRDLKSFLGKWPVTWVDVEGLGDETTIRAIGEIFGLHPLALEDVVNVHQRPKVEQYADHHFIVSRMVTLGDRLETEQLSLFLGKDFVLTFQERPGDCLDPVRERIRRGRGRIRQTGSDYLAYALLDAVVDGYFPVLEQYGDRLEALEDEVVLRPERSAILRMHAIKHDLLNLRRSIWPMREAVNSLFPDTTPLVSAETRIYLRDCYDHAIRIIDLVENYREIASSLNDIYLSSISNRMNEIMKVLTIIATIFIPLSFVAGVYGMNFDYMPEIHWPWGYPLALLLMSGTACGLLAYFWRKGWIGAGIRAADGHEGAAPRHDRDSHSQNRPH